MHLFLVIIRPGESELSDSQGRVADANSPLVCPIMSYIYNYVPFAICKQVETGKKMYI